MKTFNCYSTLHALGKKRSALASEQNCYITTEGSARSRGLGWNQENKRYKGCCWTSLPEPQLFFTTP